VHTPSGSGGVLAKNLGQESPRSIMGLGYGKACVCSISTHFNWV